MFHAVLSLTFTTPPSLVSSPSQSTHTSHWSEKLSDKVALERLSRKFHPSLEMVECLSCLFGNHWRLLPPIGLSRGLSEHDVMVLGLSHNILLIKSVNFVYDHFTLIDRPLCLSLHLTLESMTSD